MVHHKFDSLVRIYDNGKLSVSYKSHDGKSKCEKIECSEKEANLLIRCKIYINPAFIKGTSLQKFRSDLKGGNNYTNFSTIEEFMEAYNKID